MRNLFCPQTLQPDRLAFAKVFQTKSRIFWLLALLSGLLTTSQTALAENPPANGPIVTILDPVFGVPLNDLDTIYLCEEMVTGGSNVDVMFELNSLLPDPNHYVEYDLNVTITDPNPNPFGGTVVTSILEPMTIPTITGNPGAVLNYTVEDFVSIFPRQFFLEPAFVEYHITARVINPNGPDPCPPENYKIIAKIIPSPEIEIDDPQVNGMNLCNLQEIALSATGNPANGAYSWNIYGGQPGVSGNFSNPFSSTTTFTPSLNLNMVPPGTGVDITLQASLTDGNNCTAFDTITFTVYRGGSSLACNDLVNITLDGDCSATVLPDDVLEGTYPDYGIFDVVILDRSRNIGNVVTGAQIGRNLQVRVYDRCNNNYCWGNLTVEDKMAPTIDCSAAGNVPTQLVSGTIDVQDDQYCRTELFLPGSPPASCMLSVTAPNVYYETFEFTVDSAGTYNLSLYDTSIPDPFASLYANPFEPGFACDNLIASDDATPGSYANEDVEIEVFLTPGEYTLVTTTGIVGQTGTYQWVIDGPPLSNGPFPGVTPLNQDTIVVTCAFDLATIPPPPAFDNCDGPVQPNFIGETTTNFACGRADGTVRIVERTWRAQDRYGNKSTYCKQIIKIVRRGLNAVVFPPNYDNVEEDALDCGQPMSDAHPTLTGFPSVDGSPLSTGNLCMLNVGYNDVVLPTCGTSKKILREWTVLDWCLPLTPGVNPLRHTQIILFEDTTAPAIVCPDTIVASTDPDQCLATVEFPPIQVMDDCSGAIVSINTPYGGVQGNGGIVPNFPIGEYDVTYIVRDSCNNDTSCTVRLIVEDQIEPVAICIEYLVVSLTSANSVTIDAVNFDAGSFDNCCIDRFEVKRMGEPDSLFAPDIDFNCADAGDSVNVIMRVFDCFGNYNECMIIADIQDKLAPRLICPTNRVLSCADDVQDFNLTGTPIITDNCGLTPLQISEIDNRDRCGVGTFERTFSISDVSGNSRSCTQVITFVNDQPFDSSTIVWPLDTMFLGNCSAGTDPDDLDPGYDYPTFVNSACSDVLTSHSDMVFYSVPGACFKIRRTWKLLDWCTMDEYRHVQEIAVVDNEAPVFDNCPDSLEVFVGSNCLATFVIDTPMVTDCNPQVRFSLSGDLGTSLDTIRNVGLGTYNVTITADDRCGNSATCSFPVIVRDTIGPSASCVNGIAVELDNFGEADLTAEMLNVSSADNCTPVTFSFSNTITDTLRVLSCADTGTQMYNLYVWDDFGNFDICVATVDVQDNNDACDGSKPALAGNIKNAQQHSVPDVRVTLSGMGGNAQMTNNQGHYQFDNLVSGEDYSALPFRDGDDDNGVSTFDLVLISKHILNTELLNSPYKIIAADANNSGSVTTLDLVVLRKLILRVSPDIPNNTSWRFVRADYVFPDPANPWSAPFPEIYNINDISGQMMDAHFVAIKIGDINGDADLDLYNGVGNRNASEDLQFMVEEQEFEAGDMVTVNIETKGFKKVLGYQYTLHFSEALDLFNLEGSAEVTRESFGTTMLEKGILTTSWYRSNPTSIEDGATLYTLQFIARSDGKLSENLWVDGSQTRAESYQFGLNTKGVNLDFDADNWTEKGITLYQNVPNPFKDQTTIRFYMPESQVATFSVVDVSGKVIRQTTRRFDAGMNEIVMSRVAIGQSGVLYYRLQSGNFNDLKKMILVK